MLTSYWSRFNRDPSVQFVSDIDPHTYQLNIIHLNALSFVQY